MRNSYFLKDKHLYYKYPNFETENRQYDCWFVVALAAVAVSGAYSAYSQYQQGKAQGKMYEYQESLSQQNQELTRQQAKQQADLIKKTSERNINLTQGAAAEESKRLAGGISRVYGTQRAATGTLGIGGVTAIDIIKDTFDKANKDQAAIRYNADVRSYEYSENARNQVWTVQEEAKNRVWALGEEAKQYSVAAKYARKAGRTQAVGTLLTTAASMATMGAKMAPSGGGGTANVAGMGEVKVAPPNYYQSSAARF